jgi:uncharacterized membrane protein
MNQHSCTNCGVALRQGAKFCPNCGVEIKSDVTAQEVKSARPGKKAMSKQAKVFYSAAGVVILGVFFFVFTSHIGDQPHPVIEKQQSVAMYTMYTDLKIDQHPVKARVENGKIIIPVSLLFEKKMLEFEYDGPTTVVPLLAYISNEGKLVTSIRFCEPCNSKSFSIEGKELLCGNCTTRWNLNNLKGISGSCQKYPPAPIPSMIVGNEIQIDEHFARNWKSRL